MRLRLRLLSLERERLLWPCRELWESWPNLRGINEKMTPDLGDITSRTLISVYLCFERDLFLGILAGEHERERRGRLE